MNSDSILARLTSVIEERKTRLPENSYTTTLFEGGTEAIGVKIIEEAAETVDAARSAAKDREHFIYESADLLFHLMVMLAHCGASLADVEEELERRFGKSGLRR